MYKQQPEDTLVIRYRSVWAHILKLRSLESIPVREAELFFAGVDEFGDV